MVLNSNRDGADNSGKAYENVTLVGNWYEDRVIVSAEGLPPVERVISKDFPPETSEWQTTNQATQSNRRTSVPPAPINKPSMYSEANLADRLQAYGDPNTLAYTMGATQPKELANPPTRLLETTNYHFYEARPAMQQTMLEGSTYFAPPAHTHYHKGTLEKDTLDKSRDPSSVPLGSKGARGEITRRPVEAGSAYGVSVFVDEYAKWPAKLEGTNLSETVAKKKTQHF